MCVIPENIAASSTPVRDGLVRVRTTETLTISTTSLLHISTAVVIEDAQEVEVEVEVGEVLFQGGVE